MTEIKGKALHLTCLSELFMKLAYQYKLSKKGFQLFEIKQVHVLIVTPLVCVTVSSTEEIFETEKFGRNPLVKCSSTAASLGPHGKCGGRINEVVISGALSRIID